MKYGLSYIVKRINRSFVKSVENINWKETLYQTSGLIKPKVDASKPKISIVMPSFNQAEYIERSILSILNQNYSNYELIVIDGGSTDGTIDIINKYEPYISYWISEKDGGQSEALNKGFAQAKGEVFCWMNSDDIFMPNSFNIISKFFLKGYPVIFGDVLAIDKNDKILRYQITFPFSVRQFIYDGFVHNAQSMFWSKELHQKFGLFSEDLIYTMDYDFIVRISKIYSPKRWQFLPRALAAFRCYKGQKTGSAHDLAMLEHQKIAERLGFGDKFSKRGKRLKWLYYINRHLWYFFRFVRSFFIRDC